MISIPLRLDNRSIINFLMISLNARDDRILRRGGLINLKAFRVFRSLVAVDNLDDFLMYFQKVKENIIPLIQSDTSDVVGEYYYDDQGFRVRRLSRRDEGSGLTEHDIVYPSKYFCTEVQRDEYGVEIPDTYSVSNNIYLNGVRIAAMIPTGEALYYLTDQVDSVKVVVDDWANAVTRMEYLPYGETWIHEGDTDHAPKYNSQELDKETNFYFYNARHYDPEIARFVTPDKVLWKGGIKIYRKDV